MSTLLFQARKEVSKGTAIFCNLLAIAPCFAFATLEYIPIMRIVLY